jgi:hypothetical protein
MTLLHKPLLVGALLWVFSSGCSAKESLLDASNGGAKAGGPTGSGGAGGRGGSGAGASGGAAGTGAVLSTGGTDPIAGRSAGGSTTAVATNAAGSGGRATGGEGATGGVQSTGGASMGGAAGAGESSGEAGSGGAAGAGGCPSGQMWCVGCTVDSGVCAVMCPTSLCPACSDMTTLEECEARVTCHSVFQDPGTCGCASVGCCAQFQRCADGATADCQGGAGVSCGAMTPRCESPAYVVSYTATCFEGCVAPKECAPKVCAAPNDPAKCACYSDADCSTGSKCYGADCTNDAPGTCMTPPANGCFGDADCPSGQTCIGGHPAPCGTTVADRLGTCGVEACPDGDCPGATGPACTCESSNQCVAATGATGSGQCRNDDGTCATCKCAAPDTQIATPTGERAIADLAVGDLVYSVDRDGIRAVPILRINRTPVVNHGVLRVTFDNGRFIEMSAGHPLPDGRPLSALEPGTELVGAAVVSVTSVPYAHAFTYDILPASTSGAYFASDVLIGSTLSRGSGLQR